MTDKFLRKWSRHEAEEKMLNLSKCNSWQLKIFGVANVRSLYSLLQLETDNLTLVIDDLSGAFYNMSKPFVVLFRFCRL